MDDIGIVWVVVESYFGDFIFIIRDVIVDILVLVLC